MFACIAAGYPRQPHDPLPDLLAAAELQLAAGEITSSAFADVERESVRDVILEQERAGIAILADSVSHPGRVARLIEGLGGTTTGEVVLLPDGESVRRPHFDGLITWQEPILVGEWLRADGVTDLLVKQVIAGPYTIARLAEPDFANRERIATSLAESLNAEILALFEAGCPIVQVDEGGLTAIGDDDREWRLYAETQRRLTAGLENEHLSLGLYRGAVHPSGHRAILDGPYLSYLVDALAGPDAWRFIFAAPPDRGIITGIVDAQNRALDESETMVWALAWAAEGGRGNDRVGLAPNGSLGMVTRHAARRKIERMGEAVRVANMGPLAEVAEALDPTPLTSRMESLRLLAGSVAAAQRSTARHS